MKHFFLTLTLFIYSVGSFSQITQLEYFFDTDPGVGNATPLTLNNSNVVDQNFSIPTTGLPEGIHQLNIRIKKSNGSWSLYDRKIFYINPYYSNTSQITAAEYFFDTDPGVGNATTLSINNTNIFDQNFSIPTTGLSEGIHQLNIRVKKTNGNWSLYDRKIFYINPDYPNASLITQMEYFFDVDPGVGNAIAININDTQIFDDDLSIQAPNNLSPGDHFLYLRVMNTDGTWSLYAQSETVTAVDSDEYVLKNLKFYPNPAKNILYFEVENASIQSVKIIDSYGKIVNKTSISTHQIYINNLSNGIYLLQIETDKGNISKKFIKN